MQARQVKLQPDLPDRYASTARRSLPARTAHLTYIVIQSPAPVKSTTGSSGMTDRSMIDQQHGSPAFVRHVTRGSGVGLGRNHGLRTRSEPPRARAPLTCRVGSSLLPRTNAPSRPRTECSNDSALLSPQHVHRHAAALKSGARKLRLRGDRSAHRALSEDPLLLAGSPRQYDCRARRPQAPHHLHRRVHRRARRRRRVVDLQPHRTRTTFLSRRRSEDPASSCLAGATGISSRVRISGAGAGGVALLDFLRLGDAPSEARARPSARLEAPDSARGAPVRLPRTRRSARVCRRRRRGRPEPVALSPEPHDVAREPDLDGDFGGPGAHSGRSLGRRQR